MSRYQVVVVGGGISGLSACARLIENGIKNILLIEAEDRLGGRMKTIPFQDRFLEIGAQWMHGTENNPVYEIARLIDNVDESEDPSNTTFYATQDGSPLDEGIIEQVINKTKEIIDNFEEAINQLGPDTQKSIGDLLDEAYPSLVEEFGDKADPALLEALFKAGQTDERIESSCDDLHDLSAIGWVNYERLEGNQFTKLKNGYTKIIEHLASLIPAECIKLNQAVESIDWSESEYAKITTDQCEFEADYVICTIPLGVLKKQYQSMFTPELPTEKSSAIEKLGFGCINKIFVKFDRKFDDDFQGFQVLWKQGVSFNIEPLKSKWNVDENIVKSLDTFDRLPTFDNVLFAFNVGPPAIQIESLSDECVLDIISHIISSCFAGQDIPKPVELKRSKWNGNPHSFGAYSYIKTGTTPEDMNNLANPLNDRVYFAGEGTVPEYYGTVHGAFISGRRTADKIIGGKEASSESSESNDE